MGWRVGLVMAFVAAAGCAGDDDARAIPRDACADDPAEYFPDRSSWCLECDPEGNCVYLFYCMRGKWYETHCGQPLPDAAVPDAGTPDAGPDAITADASTANLDAAAADGGG